MFNIALEQKYEKNRRDSPQGIVCRAVGQAAAGLTAGVVVQDLAGRQGRLEERLALVCRDPSPVFFPYEFLFKEVLVVELQLSVTETGFVHYRSPAFWFIEAGEDLHQYFISAAVFHVHVSNQIMNRSILSDMVIFVAKN